MSTVVRSFMLPIPQVRDSDVVGIVAFGPTVETVFLPAPKARGGAKLEKQLAGMAPQMAGGTAFYDAVMQCLQMLTQPGMCVVGRWFCGHEAHCLLHSFLSFPRPLLSPPPCTHTQTANTNIKSTKHIHTDPLPSLHIPTHTKHTQTQPTGWRPTSTPPPPSTDTTGQRAPRSGCAHAGHHAGWRLARSVGGLRRSRGTLPGTEREREATLEQDTPEKN